MHLQMKNAFTSVFTCVKCIYMCKMHLQIVYLEKCYENVYVFNSHMKYIFTSVFTRVKCFYK
jgi:hypothetical protein